MNWMRGMLLAALVAAGAVPCSAAESPLTPEQIKSAARVETITIPMPGEFFAAIGKQGRLNWMPLVRQGTPKSGSSRAQIALALGALVADGYIAVEAQDGQAVKNIGKEIINLAKKLNVSESVLGRGNSLNDFAENNEWNALREELEATQNEVKLDMEEQKDTNLITLVTLGAWVRGTEIVSGIVEDNYTAPSAGLLHQPAIIEYLIGQIAALPEAMQKDPLVAEIRGLLEKSLAFVAGKTPSEDHVKALHAAMSLAVTAIAKGPAGQ